MSVGFILITHLTQGDDGGVVDVWVGDLLGLFSRMQPCDASFVSMLKVPV
jgi:hypothetical protein